MVGITIAAGWGIFSDTKVEFSKPAIVINDRIITEQELNHLKKSKRFYRNKEEFIDSLIVKELLIQEAIKQKINKDESFRASVEDFYEQSLVKILMDDQFKKYDPKVSDKEIERYKTFAKTKVFITKLIYKNKADIQKGKPENVQTIESNFSDLSDSLKYIIFNLQPGEKSKIIKAVSGFIVYKLIKTEKIADPGIIDHIDSNSVISEFIKNAKKEEFLSAWVDSLRTKAEIWRRK